MRIGVKAGVLDVTRLLFLCGIQLIGLPALQAVSSSASVCPFHLQGGRFTGSHPAFSTTYHVSSAFAGWTCRFCSGAKALALRPCGRCNSACGAEFPQALKARRPHTNSPAIIFVVWWAINFWNLYLMECPFYGYGWRGL